MAHMPRLNAQGVTDLRSYSLGKDAERERIINIIEDLIEQHVAAGHAQKADYCCDLIDLINASVKPAPNFALVEHRADCQLPPYQCPECAELEDCE